MRVVHLPQKGRGRALHAVWSTSDAPVLAYMDVDLSTDLDALLPLVAPLISGHSDVAIGTRLARGARVVRGPKREFISRCYNLILRGRCAAGSATRSAVQGRARDAAGSCCPLVEDTGGSSTPSCWCWPSGPAAHPRGARRLGGRPGLRSTSSRRRSADLKGVARVLGGLASGRIPVDRIRARLGRSPLAA